MIYKILLFLAVVSIFLYILDKSVYDYFDTYKIKNVSPNDINIDEYLPDNIYIKEIEGKGWGLVSKNKINKNDIVYVCPISIFPDGTLKMVSKCGEKIIDKNIHICQLERDLHIFPYFDVFLNNENEPNAYHDVKILMYKNIAFFTLIALKDIEADEEITINYVYLTTYTVRLFLFLTFPDYFKSFSYINKYPIGYPISYLDKVVNLINPMMTILQV